MKFEINENKLDKIIFRYLDGKNFIIKETDNFYYFFESESDEYIEIKVRKRDMSCFIKYELSDEIKSFFTIDNLKVKDVLKKYINNILNVKITNSYDSINWR
jgi:hypothetical protein